MTNHWLEVAAATVEAAIREALEKLGAVEEDVVIEVLSTPRSGLLGLGARQARVRVRRRQPGAARSDVQSPPLAPPLRPPATGEERPQAAAPGADTGEAEGAASERQSATLEEQSRQAMAMLERILELMGEKAEVVVAATDAEAVELEVKGDGSGILIGRRGQTLDALEYLVNRLLAGRVKDAVPVVIDIESYRARRRHQLERMALSKGEQAKREHRPVTLDPMPPRERRIIHLALKDDPLVTTRSAGTGYLRALEIVPAESKRERSSRERPQEREPLGEQGGFKYGQKKIV